MKWMKRTQWKASKMDWERDKMSKKSIFLTLLLFSLAAVVIGCSSTPASKGSEQSPAENDKNADMSWQAVQENEELIVGLCAAYPPFESRNEQTGEIEGFDIDLAKSIAEEIGINVKIIDAEWQALLGGLNKGDYDVLITAMSKKEASVENVNMSDVYYNLDDVIVVNNDNSSITSVEDLEGKIVGVQLGSGSEQYVDQLSGLKEIRRYNYNPEAFIDLENKRIDAVVVGYAYAVDQIADNPIFKVLEEPIGSAEIVMVTKAGADELTEKLNEGLRNIKANGIYDGLVSKWLSIE